MPRNNFGSYFLRGFGQTFNPTFQNVMDNLLQEKRQKAIMDEQNRREAEKLQREQGQRGIATNLIKGGESLNVPAGLMPQLPAGIQGFNQYTPDQSVSQLGKLDMGGLQYYNALNKLLTPKAPTKAPTISAGGNLYGYKLNPETQQLEVDTENPLVKAPKKILTTQSGWGQNGEKRTVITYDDGTQREVTSGGFVRTINAQGGVSEKFDLNLYRVAENQTESGYNKIKKEMIDYPEMMQTTNDKMGQEESIFYNTMLPSARQYIDVNYYNTLKSKNLPPDFEYSRRTDLSKNFISSVTEDYKDGTLNAGNFKIDFTNYPKPKNVEADEWHRQVEAEVYKSILLWSKLKFDRL